jgi:hypothetical protein
MNEKKLGENMDRKFEYSRGTEYTCIVIVSEEFMRVTFSNITCPQGTTNEIKEAFLDEAELAVFKALEE